MSSIDIKKYQRGLNKKLKTFSGHFMSDAKWTKLFKILASNSDKIKRCLIKDIWNNQFTEITIPDMDSYLEVFHDKGIKDVIISGPIAFNEIEYIVFPKTWEIDRVMQTQKIESTKLEQDIAAINEILNGIGQFEFELDDKTLTVFAYK